jgi:type IV secretion system protein TrbL
LFLVVLCVVAVSSHAAAFDLPPILGDIDKTFKPLQKSWYEAIKVYAERLFWLLVLIDFSWTTILYALEKSDFVEIISSLVKKIFTIGFFFSLLKFSDTWIPSIIDSLRQIGTTVGKVEDSTPDGILKIGWETANAAFLAMQNLGTMEKLAVVMPVTIMAIAIFLAFVWIAAQLLVTIIESYLVVGAGVILLGFGGSRWTTDFATKYIQHAFGTGLKLMLAYLIVGAGQTLFQSMALSQTELIRSLLVALASAFIYCYLAIQIPQMASAMLSGSPSMTAGSLAGSAITMGAAIAGGVGATAAGAAGAAAAGGAAASSLAGLSKAVGAGVASGLDMGKSGGGLAAHAVGQVAAHGLGLASGALGGMVDKASAAVDDTTGGKIASSIEATRGGSISGSPDIAPPSGGSSSGAAGGATAPSSAQGSPAAQPASTSATGGSSGGGSSGGAGGGDGSASASAPAASAAGSASASPSSSPAAPSRAVAPPTSTASPSTPAAPASAGPAAASPPADTGNASSASVAGGDTAPAQGGGGGAQPGLHDRISNLEGYVPQDGGQLASVQIDLKHTAD